MIILLILTTSVMHFSNVVVNADWVPKIHRPTIITDCKLLNVRDKKRILAQASAHKNLQAAASYLRAAMHPSPSLSTLRIRHVRRYISFITLIPNSWPLPRMSILHSSPSLPTLENRHVRRYISFIILMPNSWPLPRMSISHSSPSLPTLENRHVRRYISFITLMPKSDRFHR